MRAVDDHPQPGQRRAVGGGTSTAGGRGSARRRRPRRGPGRTRRRAPAGRAASAVREPACLDLRPRPSSGSLQPAAGEELDPVVRASGCGEPRASTPRSAPRSRGQVRDRRGRQHAEPEHVDAGAGQAGDDRGLEELAAGPRVAADHRERAAAVGTRRAEGPHAVQHAQPRPRPGPGPARRSGHGRQLRGHRPYRTAGPMQSTPGRSRCSVLAAARYALVQRPAPWPDQRLEYCGALRAFFRPYFLRSLTRASRVRKPAFFSAGRFVRVDHDQRAGDAQPQRAGLAGDAAAGDPGDDVELARPRSSVTNGSLMSCWCTLFGKYSSSVRPLIGHWPVPGTMRTRAMASLRRPVPWRCRSRPAARRSGLRRAARRGVPGLGGVLRTVLALRRGRSLRPRGFRVSVGSDTMPSSRFLLGSGYAVIARRRGRAATARPG